MLVFKERGKPAYSGKKTVGLWCRFQDWNSGHTGGRRVPSPLSTAQLLLPKKLHHDSACASRLTTIQENFTTGCKKNWLRDIQAQCMLSYLLWSSAIILISQA